MDNQQRLSDVYKYVTGVLLTVMSLFLSGIYSAQQEMVQILARSVARLDRDAEEIARIQRQLEKMESWVNTINVDITKAKQACAAKR